MLGERVGQGPVRGGGLLPERAQGGGRQRAGPRHLPGQAAGRSDALQFLSLLGQWRQTQHGNHGLGPKKSKEAKCEDGSCVLLGLLVFQLIFKAVK